MVTAGVEVAGEAGILAGLAAGFVDNTERHR